jgi:hypothetical protein
MMKNNFFIRAARWIPACAAMTALLFFGTAYAKDKKKDKEPVPETPGYHYAPPGCDFRIDFPGEPFQAKRCDPDDSSKCNAVTSFTHVFALDATVNFNVTCNPPEKNMYDHYSGEVMKETLIALVGKGKLDKYETDFQQFPEAKQASLLGTGKSGNSEKIYIAQLWIGHQSVFTVEGELIGEQTDDADKMFADILRSIRYKDWKLSAPKKK